MSRLRSALKENSSIIKRIFLYFIMPLIIFILVFLLIYFIFGIKDFEKIFVVELNIISALGIIIGGFWAYRKFGWEKKCENIIKLKYANEK